MKYKLNMLTQLQVHYINYQLFFPNLVSILAWCARSIGRRLTSTVEARPFLEAICCFAADIISWITVADERIMNIVFTKHIHIW